MSLDEQEGIRLIRPLRLICLSWSVVGVFSALAVSREGAAV